MIWGIGNEGQLGTGSIVKKGIRHVYEELHPVELNTTPYTISKLVFGQVHSLAVTDCGKLMAWGSKEYGKLGVPVDVGTSSKEDGAVVLAPHVVEALEHETIVDAACTGAYSLALTESGGVYSWGWGGSFMSGVGALGHGDEKSHEMPTKIQALEEDGVRISKISVGEKHCLALSDDGEIWAWGNGEYGRMGNGDSDSMLAPEPLEFFAEMNIVDIAAGEAFSLALSEDGKVYAWGKNEYGQLGLGGTMTMDIYNMETMPIVVRGELEST